MLPHRLHCYDYLNCLPAPHLIIKSHFAFAHCFYHQFQSSSSIETMACKQQTEDVEAKVAPSRLWAAMKDSHNLLPKVAPEFCKSVELHGSGPHPGSTRTVHFGPAAAENTGSTYLKEKLVSIDEASRTICIEAVEGGSIGKLFSSLKTTSTLAEGKDANSTTVKVKVEYVPIGDATPEKLREGSLHLLKKIEAYLQAHPNLYA